jgi:membrane protease YdiL (CAAX protease family)
VEASALAYPAIITFVILPAIFEEALYRGYLSYICASVLPKGLTPFMIAVLFTIVHGRPEVFLALFVLSLILTASVLLTRSILPAVAIHALSNLVLLFFPALIT